MSKKKVLFVLHLPPPFHGAAEVGRQIRESALVNGTFETRYVNLSASRSLEELGRLSVRKATFLFNLLRQVRREVRTWKPDLVYLTPSSTMPALLKDCLVRRCAGGCRTLLHFHNKGVASRQDRLVDNFLYRRLFHGSHVILLSPLLYPDIRKYVAPELVSYCPNGLSVPETVHAPGEVPRILFLSNLLRSKGVPVLLEACRILKDRGLPFSCSLVGALSADYPGDTLSAEIREKGLDDRVVYEGPVYGEGKWAVFSKADVFVHPTLNDSFPLVILEAMGSGLPVVATEEGGIPEMVRNGVDGLTCPKNDPAALADALGKLLSDKELRTRMGESGKARYRERYTEEQFEKRFVDILKDA